MQLTLIRGLPGSGKTTLARKIVATQASLGVTTLHVEGDQYFELQGEYFFRVEWLKEAHQRCHRLAEVALFKGFDVVVSNTFTRLNEMYHYLNLADSPMIDVNVIHCVADHGSIHNVPADALERMKLRWEDYEPESIYDS